MESPPPDSAPALDNVADGVDHKLDPRWITLERRTGLIGSAIYGVIWLGVAFVVTRMDAFPDGLAPWLFGLWALLAIVHTWWGQRRPEIAYRHYAYRVDEFGVEIRSGILWRNVIDVPRSRVQHTDVSQGPFERRFGLGTLSIFTAGVSHAMVALPGLEHGRALRIRDSLLSRESVDVA